MLIPHPALAPCRDCSCAALRRASRAVTQHYEACFRGSGLRATQFTLLVALAQTGPLTLSKLAEVVGLERTTLTRNLRLLEARGWVQTVADDADRRRRRIALTRAGLKKALFALPGWRQAQSSVGRVLDRLGLSFSTAKKEK